MLATTHAPTSFGLTMYRGRETLQGAVRARYSHSASLSLFGESFSLSRDDNMVDAAATDRDITSPARPG